MIVSWPKRTILMTKEEFFKKNIFFSHSGLALIDRCFNYWFYLISNIRCIFVNLKHFQTKYFFWLIIILINPLLIICSVTTLFFLLSNFQQSTITFWNSKCIDMSSSLWNIWICRNPIMQRFPGRYLIQEKEYEIF